MTDPSEIPNIIEPAERAGVIAQLEQELGGVHWDRYLHELGVDVEPGSPAELTIIIELIDKLATRTNE